MTTVKYEIEVADSAGDSWRFLTLKHSDENLSSVLEVLRKAYPDKRFRAVKVTETREVVA